MSAVTALPWGRPITRDDLDTMPDDGHRYELIDGTLLVSPAPSLRHQDAVAHLGWMLRVACPPELRCVIAPFEVVLPGGAVFQPDVLIARMVDLTNRDLPAAPVLAVEVLSPSTRSIDLLLKYSRYAAEGVAHYWVIDPDTPSLTVYQLGGGGAYEQVAVVTGSEAYATTDPITVTVIPNDLFGPATPP